MGYCIFRERIYTREEDDQIGKSERMGDWLKLKDRLIYTSEEDTSCVDFWSLRY